MCECVVCVSRNASPFTFCLILNTVINEAPVYRHLVIWFKYTVNEVRWQLHYRKTLPTLCRCSFTSFPASGFAAQLVCSVPPQWDILHGGISLQKRPSIFLFFFLLRRSDFIIEVEMRSGSMLVLCQGAHELSFWSLRSIFNTTLCIIIQRCGREWIYIFFLSV